MFIAAGRERLCPECARETGMPQGAGWRRSGRAGGLRASRPVVAPWGRGAQWGRPWRGPSSTWRPLAMACGGAIVAGLLLGVLNPNWVHTATWAGFAGGMYLADKPY